MPKFLHVGFNFAGPLKIKELEPAFSSVGDWLRYSSSCWIIWTERSAQDVFSALKPYLVNDDQFLIVEINMYERNGWLPEWVWGWMNARQQYQSNALAGLGGLAALGGQSPLGSFGIPPASSFGPPPNPFYPPKK